MAVVATQESGNAWAVPQSLGVLATIQTSRGRYAEADDTYDRAGALIDGLLGRYSGVAEKTALIKASSELYTQHFSLIADRLHEPAKAYGIVEQVRGSWPLFQTPGCFRRFLTVSNCSRPGRIIHVVSSGFRWFPGVASRYKSHFRVRLDRRHAPWEWEVSFQQRMADSPLNSARRRKKADYVHLWSLPSDEPSTPTGRVLWMWAEPPVVRQPIFAIRLRPRRIFSLAEYESGGILTHKDDP
jgi:hypothetical protein